MATTAEAQESVSGNPSVNVIEDMISNLKLDIEARNEYQELLDNAEEFISEADGRIKRASQALSFMTDYMTDEQIEMVNQFDVHYEELEASPNRGNLNEIAEEAFAILNTSKTGEMTNGALYESYAKKVGDKAVKYGEFNIKLRSLFSNTRLIRIEPEDAENSRSHIIRVNGFRAGK